MADKKKATYRILGPFIEQELMDSLMSKGKKIVRMRAIVREADRRRGARNAVSTVKLRVKAFSKIGGEITFSGMAQIDGDRPRRVSGSIPIDGTLTAS